MPYIKRNQQGAVVAAADSFSGGAPAGWEEVAADNADLLAYRYPSLSAHKTRVKAMIDDDAEKVRLKYVTPGSAQAMVYKQKAEEAAKLQDDPSPDPADYPVLSASVGIEAATLAEVATMVLTKHAQWAVMAAQIEAVRLQAKKDIDEAANVAAVNAVLDAVVWPL